MIFNITHSYLYDPKSVKEGQRLYNEAIARIILEELRKQRDIKSEMQEIEDEDKVKKTEINQQKEKFKLEYILLNTDIFDEIGEKLKNVIKVDLDKFQKEKVYKLIISLHVSLLKDSRFDTFNVPEPPYKRYEYSRFDKISDVLDFQLEKAENVLEENGIKSYSSTIQGTNLDGINIIKIEISEEEDTPEPKFTKKGKKIERNKTRVIEPSTSEEYCKTIIKLYEKLLKNPINDNMLISRILDVDRTDDEIDLQTAFAKQYGDLWFCSLDREKEILVQLEERIATVLDKQNEINEVLGIYPR